MAHLRDMQEALTRECVARGATRPPKLEMTRLDMGAPVEPEWNSTIGDSENSASTRTVLRPVIQQSTNIFSPAL
jgi:hypothetical protein